MKSNLEIRNYTVELRSNNESRNISGLAIPVESRSALLGDFYEIIRSSAINDELIQNNDIKIYIDHDPSQGTFARSKYGKGSLDLSITERGLEFSFEAPNSVFGNALLESIRRGDTDACSFGFYVGEDKWDMNEDGTYTRSILSFAGIEEISLLNCLPAYSQTEVAHRSLDEFKEAKAEEERNKEEKIQETMDKINAVESSINNLYKDYLDVTY